MEVLSRLLENKFADGSIGYHPKASEVRISSLAFTDDLMIFYDGKTSSLRGINSVLETFKGLSGLQMNTEKSAVYTAGLEEAEKEDTLAFGFVNGTFPFRYLGLPLLYRKLRRSDYSQLTDTVAARFNHWAAKTLSFAGRLQLISSVIYSTVNFWLSSFILPKCCLKIIEQMCNRFLWSNDISKHGDIKVSWQNVCLPKFEGGLGLRNFWVWNKTLNLRLIWMLFARRDSLWVAWNHSTRLRNGNFWTAKPANHHSWIWKALLSLCPLAKRFLRGNIGDGHTLSYWYDHWNELGPLIDIVGPIGPQLTSIQESAVVAEGTSVSGWILPSARTRTLSLASIRSTLIGTAPPSDNRGPDTYDWFVDGSPRSRFSAQLTWENLRPRDTTKPWAASVWYKGCIPKHDFTYWVAHLNRLPVRARTATWGPNRPSLCCICQAYTETRDHLFFHCRFSNLIWHQVLSRFRRSHMFCDWQDMADWLLIGLGALVQHLKGSRSRRLFSTSGRRETAVCITLFSPPTQLSSSK